MIDKLFEPFRRQEQNTPQTAINFIGVLTDGFVQEELKDETVHIVSSIDGNNVNVSLDGPRIIFERAEAWVPTINDIAKKEGCRFTKEWKYVFIKNKRFKLFNTFYF